MGKRSNVLIALGIALFVLGVAAVVLIVRDDEVDDAAVDPRSQVVPVLVATGDITAGMTGEEIVAQGLVEETDVRLSSRNAAAFSSAGQLAGRIASGATAAGDQVLTTKFTGSAPSAQTRSVSIPEGHEGIVIELSFLPAGGRYVAIGDRVNVYAVKSNALPQQVKRVLTDVEVLDIDRSRLTVSTQPEPAQGQAAPQAAATNPVTYLLAVTPEEAERIIFLGQNEAMYLTLASQDQPPTLTPGRDYSNLLQ